MSGAFVKTGDHTAVANNSKSRWLTTNFFCHSQYASAHFTDVAWVLTLTEVSLLPEPRILSLLWLRNRVCKIGQQFLTTSPGKGYISSDHVSLIKASHRAKPNIEEWEMPGERGAP